LANTQLLGANYSTNVQFIKQRCQRNTLKPILNFINETGGLNCEVQHWRKKYVSLSVDQAKRLKEVEKENTRMRKLVADLSLDKAILKEVAEGKY
jgi:hypothetical protein